MLELKNVTKEYKTKKLSVTALKGVSIKLRKCEFVSVLGQSGCGKTTLLNVIGGLDKYTSGEFYIGGVSAADFTESDWDAYRNERVGFVFQSYNLIPHQTALENVELALTLSGETGESKKRRAMLALEKVGLADQLHKKPSELSGGEAQRVAIARAIVNDPDIILADEPTGALDSKNGAQVMDILKEISKTRLVIAVTHNDGLANAYSTRIIRLKDGVVVSDSNPYKGDDKGDDKSDECLQKSAYKPVSGTFDKKRSAKNAKIKQKNKAEKSAGNIKRKGKTKMNFFVAMGLSFNNLLTKKVRTALTAFAGSVGIIGLALVLALNNGLNVFLGGVQTDALSAYPVTVQETETANYESYVSIITDGANYQGAGGKNKIFINHLITKLIGSTVKNKITPEYIEYAKAAKTADSVNGGVSDVIFDYGTQLDIYKRYASYDLTELKKTTDIPQSLGDSITLEYPKVEAGQYFKQILDDKELVLSQYDVVAGKYPAEANELCLVLDKNGSISDALLVAFLVDLNAADKSASGEFLKNYYTYDEFLKDEKYTTFTLVLNDGLYKKTASADGDYFKKQTRSVEKQLAGGLSTNGSNLGETVAKAVTAELNKMKIPLPECYYGNKNNTLDLKISCILRLKDDRTMGCMSVYPIGYTKALAEFARQNAASSQIVKAQKEEIEKPSGVKKLPYRNLLAPITAENAYFATEAEVYSSLKTVGYGEKPVAISFYTNSPGGKTALKKYLAAYNDGKQDDEKIYAQDLVGTVFDVLQTFINTITTILLVLTAISLFVAAIMTAVITYVSVIERTKEIGVLRAVGARRVDVMSVFNAENVILGAFSGILGILLAVVLQFPLNSALYSYTGVSGLAVLSPLHALALVGISILVNLISGFIPALAAAKKDPVKALRADD